MSDNTAGMIARRTDLLNEISEQLRAAVDEEDRPYRWEDIPDVLAEVIGERDALGAAQAGSLDNDDALRWGRILEAITQALPEDIRPSYWGDLPAAVARLAEHGNQPSPYNIAHQWREARQLLNDAGMSKHTLPVAVALLLPTPRDED